MAMLVKKPLPAASTLPVTPANTGPGFRVLCHRITSKDEVFIKNKGAFKMKIENKGQVGVTIFGACSIPSYGSEVVETGDTSLIFESDTNIEYADHYPSDIINLVITLYYK